MDQRIKFFVGLDVHKDSIGVAACDASREPARIVGTLGPVHWHPVATCENHLAEPAVAQHAMAQGFTVIT